MGYSNNKWRKILTILMIINLCFILFARFSKVFGADNISLYPLIRASSSNNDDFYTGVLPAFISNKYWVINQVKTNNGWQTDIYYCDTPFSLTTNSSKGSFNKTVTYYRLNYGGVDNTFTYTFTDGQQTSINGSNYLSDTWVNSLSFSWIFGNFDFIVNNVSVDFEYSLNKYPEIANNLEDLESLNFDVISINGWEYSTKEFDVLFYDRNIKDTTSTEGLYPKRVITLSQNTSYFQSDLSADPTKNAIFWIPIDETGLNFYIGGTYEIRLAERVKLNPPEYRC